MPIGKNKKSRSSGKNALGIPDKDFRKTTKRDRDREITLNGRSEFDAARERDVERSPLGRKRFVRSIGAEWTDTRKGEIGSC